MSRGQGYRDVTRNLLQNQNVNAALSITLSGRRNEQAIYGFWKYVRQRIIRDETNRNSNYLYRVRDFQHAHFSPQDPEWDLLQQLMEESLAFQYRVETGRQPFLRNHHQLDQTLRQIKCMPDIFYDYTLPDDIVQRAIISGREAIERKHMKAVTISDLQSILSKAREWETACTTTWELVACALILSGRRVHEIISSLEWQHENEYLARVTGIAKQGTPDEEVVIPILCPYEDFDRLMTKIRETELPTTSTTHRLKPAFMRYFGKWYNHSERRNIYGEAGFRMRQQSGFYPEASRIMWIDMALSHSTNVVSQATNLTYQSLQFNDE
jgi:hypothetical protein